VWFSADTGVTNGGNATGATGWKNRSALLSPYTLTVNAGTPTYYSTTAAKLVNYNPSVYFSGAVMQLNSSFMASSSAYSLFVVEADESTTNGYHEIYSASTTQDAFSFFKENDAAASNGWNMWFNAGGAYITDTGAVGFAGGSAGCQGYYNGTNYSTDARTQNIQPQIGVITGTHTNTLPVTYIDGYAGHLSNANNQGSQSTFFTGLALGGEYNNNLTENHLGRIVEFIAYPSQLSASNVQQVNSYLAIKYGITLGQGGTNPNVGANDGNYNYVASDGTVIWSAATNSTYKWNITGIGRDDKSGLSQKQSFSVNQSSPTANAGLGNTYGALVTVGSGTVAATNAANTNTFSANKSFDIFGDNNSTGVSITSLPTPNATSANSWLNRVWCVQETGSPGTVQLSIPSNYKELSYFNSGSTIYLVSYSSGGVSATYTALTLSGSNYVVSIDFPSGTSYFTFAGTFVPTPGAVAGPSCWFKADAGVTNTGDGTSATVWNDQSGNGYNIPVWAGSPTYYSATAAKLINYNPSIYFSGADAFRNTSAFMGSTSDYTLFVVEADETTSNNTYHGIYGAANSKDVFSFFKYNGATASNGWNMWQNNAGAYTTNTGAIGFANSGGCQGYYNGTNYTSDSRTQRVQPQIGTITKQYSGGSSTPPTTYIDGYSGTLQTYTYNSALFQGLSIGDEYTNFSNEYFLGRIVEFIAYPSQLTATQLQQVHSYLSIKYGTTLGQGGTNPNIFANDGNYNYLNSAGTTIWNATSNSTYKWNITGIGRDDNSGLNQKQSFSVNRSTPTTNNSATNTYGALVTIGLGSIATSNSTNSNTFSIDKSFDIFGDNNSTGLAGGSPPPTSISPSSYTVSASIWLNRTWCVQETGTPGTVQVSIPTNYSEFTNFSSNSPIYLVNYASAAGPAQYYQLTTSGSNYITTLDFPSGTSYFTFCGDPGSTLTTTLTTAGSYYYYAPCGVTTITVTCQGGGGGGGGAIAANASAGGGAGGSCIQSVVTVVPGTTYTVTVGAGGVGGNSAGGNGQQGGSSFFGASTVLAVGGNGGTGKTTASSGSGGAAVATGNLPAAGYLFSYYGGSGGAGVTGTPSSGGGGGGAGTGGAGGNSTTTGAGAAGGSGTGGPAIAGGAGAAGLNNTSSAGNNATAVGGGGGGAVTKTATGYAGGSGAAGQVSITQLAVPATPTVTTNNPAGASGNDLCASTTLDSIYEFKIVTPATTNTITAFNFGTTGTYATSDISYFQLWVNTSDNLSTATQLSSNLVPGSGGVTTQTFAAFTKNLSASTTYYFWITANLSSTATNNATIAISAITSSNLTLSTCSNNFATYASPTYTLSSTTVKAIANAAGANTICNAEVFTLQGASISGSATTGAWSITSGTGTLSSTSQTASPAAVTFTPSGATTQTVTLTLTTNGCVASSNRTIYVISCGSQTITSSQSWTAPCGVTTITVECYGGGGGSASNVNNAAEGAGGGAGGGYSKSTLTVTPGSSYSVTIGAGGSAGCTGCGNGTGCTNCVGGSGGTSWFSLNANGSVPASQAQGVLAYGGNGGLAGHNTGGTAGALGIGTYSVTGGPGGAGTGGNAGGGGGAAGSSSGTGATGGNSTSGASAGTGATGVSGAGSGGNGGAGNTTLGSVGNVPGGGAGGSGDQANSGVAGGAGVVVITLPSTLTHPSGGTVTSDIYGCVGVATTITGVTLSSVTTSLTWSGANGVVTGTYSPVSCANTCSLTTTYKPSAADAVTGTVPLILSQNTDQTSTCDTYDYPFNFHVLSDTSWFGGTSTDWGNTANWCGSIPTSTVSVVIPSGVAHQPTISGTSQASCLNLTINSGATLTMSTTNTLGIYGNWTNNGTFTPASSNISFLGSSTQNISGSGAQSFYNLIINNTGSSGSNLLTLLQPMTVTGTLTLTKGILVTTANTLTLTNTATNAVNSGSASSFVNGPMTWSLSGSGNTYVFPTGAGTTTTRYARIAISGVTTASDLFTCQYFKSAYAHVATSDLSTSVTTTLVTVSKDQYWTVSPLVATSAAVTLYWENAANNGINNCADLVVAHYNTSSTNKWENTNGTSAATTTGACTTTLSGTVKGGVISSFSPFTFGSTAGGGQDPLPIGLLYFDAVYNGETVDLSWSTATETNNDYFTIERSLDGIHYTVLGTIPSQAINGNSISELTYNFNDPNTSPGTYYYRLKQTDFNDNSEYSGVQEVTISGSTLFSFDIAPNPNNGKQLTLYITDPMSNQTITMTVYDVLGKEILTQNFTTVQSGNSSFPVYFQKTLSAGVYIVTISANNHPTLSKRLIVN